MGQPSIPALNRSGNAMFWISSWNDYYNFHLRFQEELFLSKLTQSLAIDRMSSNEYFWKSLKTNYGTKYTTTHLILLWRYGSAANYCYTTKLLPFLRKFYRIPIFHTRVSILNLDNYFILTLRTFHPIILDKKLYIRTMKKIDNPFTFEKPFLNFYKFKNYHYNDF